jgi:CheY-like chemotaxis protein
MMTRREYVAEGCRQALVVEDDEDIRDLLSTLLTVLGFEVREANNGEIGLEMLRGDWRPDLIVLDLMMPVMNGWAFRAQQRKIDGLRDVPVIVLSARRPPYREAEASFEVAEILPKPFDLDNFLAAVSRHCPDAASKQPAWLGTPADRASTR